MDPLKEEARRKARERRKRQRDNATPAAIEKRQKTDAASKKRARSKARVSS